MLRGTIGDQSLADVFRLLALANKTGRLEVKRAAASGEVLFGAGDVCRAHASSFDDPLGARLVRLGRASREQVRLALDRQVGERRPLGEILVDERIIGHEVLRKLLEEQIVDIAVELLDWRSGEFVWTPLAELEFDLPVAVPVEEIINEFVRRADDLDMRWRKGPGAGSLLGDVAEGRAMESMERSERRPTASGPASTLIAPAEVGTADPSSASTGSTLLTVPPEGSMAQAGRQDQLFDIIVVCTGNQFRSPIVEGLLRSSSFRLPLRVSSVGTANLGPARALPEAVELASEFGVDLSSHRARTLRNFDLSGADLVLGFEVAHVAEAVVEASAAIDRTFTLVELVELLHLIDAPNEEDPVERARQVVARAHAARPKQGMRAPDYQIRDPLGGPAHVYRETAWRLRELSRRLLEGLFGHTPIQPPPPPTAASTT
jgi:protein-tyrosine phosphatase